MFVSVVLPTRDRAAVVGDAIRSVLDQSHRDLELVVVDDGDDATPEVVASFDDDRLRYIRRDDPLEYRRDDPGGVSEARNAGVRLADEESEAVAFIDSDDRWHPEKLRRQIEALREAEEVETFRESDSNYGVVYAPVTKREGEPRTRDGASGDVSEAVRTLSVPTYTSTLLVRREAFRQVGGFDEDLDCFEDWDLCLRLAREWAFAYVDAPLVLKGTDAENVSADPDRVARGVRRVLAKHDLPAEARAQLLADAGRTYCEAGRLATGRPYLRRALSLDVRPNAAAALALSLPGSPRLFDAGMDAVYAAERWLSRNP